MEVPDDVMHFNQKLAAYKKAGNDVWIEAVQGNCEQLAKQLSMVMRQGADVANFCEENYGVKFRVTVNPFAFTVRRITYAGGSSWIALTVSQSLA